ncbi:MAG: TIGR03087 family PEP-CTERM/XrtA system glycosyltransferase [Paucibacter sp.]|nr:TIGR03087 family PEP-CTERM/XrtA system glycosyltransferase [Roseateles sp.]MBV8380868.1 TIGR03087 family PEP-CTERM/XrtA system glycosyltransferase [Roseateles sp.]
MAKILYLVHRLPYPPNKGDKVRSFHLLKHLAACHEVYLATFVDDPDDWQYLTAVSGYCADVCARPLHPLRGRMMSLAALWRGEPLSLRYYRDAELARWTRAVCAQHRIEAAVVFSSTMAPYAQALNLPTLVDLVDVDSAKWSAYARNHRWPLSALYAREGRSLLEFERATVGRAAHSYLVTSQELALFESLVPEAAGRASALCNGVDAEYFDVDAQRPTPFAGGTRALVFTGAMDYWPNIDAVSWFAREVLPNLVSRWPDLKFYIVGRNPSAAVQALASEHVCVTGTVPDVRPYLQHAALVVAPLRLARGIQNKVLEAMAMGRPVVAASTLGASLEARPEQEIVYAQGADDYAAAIGALLRNPEQASRMGQAARACVLEHYGWDAHLQQLDVHLAQLLEGAQARRSAA